MRSLSCAVGRMSHCLAASGFKCLTHLGKNLIRRLTHERDELGAILEVHRPDPMMCLSVGRAVPIEISATRTPTVAAVLADGDLGISRVASAGYRTKLAEEPTPTGDARRA